MPLCTKYLSLVDKKVNLCPFTCAARNSTCDRANEIESRKQFTNATFPTPRTRYGDGRGINLNTTHAKILDLGLRHEGFKSKRK